MIKFISMVLFYSFMLLNSGHSIELQVVTTQEPPMTFLRGGSVTGISADLINEILKRTGNSIEISMYSRAYNIGSTEKNVAIFTMGRTPKREKLFHWISPLVGKRWV